MLCNDDHKQAVKRALATLVVHRGHVPDLAALGVSGAAFAMSLKPGDLDSYQAQASYADGVARNAERQSNRRWPTYNDAVRALAHKLANEAEAEIDRILA